MSLKKCADQHPCDFFLLFFQGPVVRTLCLSETCIIERDPATYIIVSCFPLSDVSVIDLSVICTFTLYIFRTVSYYKAFVSSKLFINQVYIVHTFLPLT